MDYGMSSKNYPIEDILKLYHAPNVGPTTYISLVDEFGSPADVFGKSANELCKIKRITKDRASAILADDAGEFISEQLESMNRTGCRLVSYWDDEYPQRLRAIVDPPPFYFIKGDMIKEDDYSLAVVGTRGVTDYGKAMTDEIVTGLAREGMTIISGLASGVDTHAHKAALAIGGRSIAVLGSGIDRIYPQENVDLSMKLIESGCLISEFPMGTAPDRGNFPQRNRIISGLSLGTLVIEGDVNSGALITAYYAVDQNREVFALPGKANAKKSRGPHRLISTGAKLITSAEDILSELDAIVERKREPRQAKLNFEFTPEEQSMMELLSSDPLYIDDIAERGSITTSQALATLLGLELRSLVRQLPGKMFISLI